MTGPATPPGRARRAAEQNPSHPRPHHYVLAFSARLSPRVLVTTVWGYLRRSPDQRLTSHLGPATAKPEAAGPRMTSR